MSSATFGRSTAAGVLAVVAAATALAGAPAAAETFPTASVSRGSERLVYLGASASEHVLVTSKAGRLVVEVIGPEVTAGQGCAATETTPSYTLLDCGLAFSSQAVQFDLKGGDDTVEFLEVAPRGSVLGGADDDRVTLGPASTGHAVEFSGGEGRDTVDYSKADAPVRVSLDLLGGDGRMDIDDDDIADDVEDILGSAYNDRLDGSNTDNVLQGGPGRDYLYGLGGNDHLYANGDDFLPAPAEQDILNCGAGLNDSGHADDDLDYVPANCEIQPAP